MFLELGRRISMILLIVAVATGFAVPAAHAATHHSQMAVTAIITMDHAADCAHEGCPIDQNVDMHGTCFAPCAGVTALPPATAMAYLTVARDVFMPSLDPAMVDRNVAPDPHPPKSSN
jgi:hypothetical protein